MTTAPHAPTAPDTARAASACATANAFDILLHCHEHILSKLQVLEQTARDLDATGSFEQRHLAGLGDVVTMLDTAIPMHSADEEQSLFPRLRALPEFEGAAGHTPMDCMQDEHVQHQKLMAALKRAVMQRDVGRTVMTARHIVAEYRGHIEKENEVLFPFAREKLTDPRLIEELTEEMRGRRREAGLLAC